MNRKVCWTVLIPTIILLLLLAAVLTVGCAGEVSAGETATEWNYCPEGMRQVPEWSEGICGDEDFIDMSTCRPPGEVENTGPDPRQAAIKILSVYGRYHCLKDPVAFWPLTAGITVTFPVTKDVIVAIDFPQGRWGLGGDGEDCHAPHEQFLSLVLKH